MLARKPGRDHPVRRARRRSTPTAPRRSTRRCSRRASRRSASATASRRWRWRWAAPWPAPASAEFGRTPLQVVGGGRDAVPRAAARAVGVDVARRRGVGGAGRLRRRRHDRRTPRSRRSRTRPRGWPACSSTPRCCTPSTARRCSSTSCTTSPVLEPTWTMTNVIDEQVAAIRAQVGDKRVICGLSGGVDSAVAAALVHRAVGDQLTCVFVDHGLLRKGEAEQVERDYVDGDRRTAQGRRRGQALPRRARRGQRPRGEAQGDRPRVHPGLRGGGPRRRRRGRGRTGRPSSSWCRARSIPTSSSPAAAPARPTSSPTTTWAACPTTCSSPWSSRCARCSRTRCAGSGSSSACPRRSSGGSRSPARASASGSSAR